MNKEKRHLIWGTILIGMCLSGVLFLIWLGIQVPNKFTLTDVVALMLNLLGVGQGIMYIKDSLNKEKND
jgi:hypothetical protein